MNCPDCGNTLAKPGACGVCNWTSKQRKRDLSEQEKKRMFYDRNRCRFILPDGSRCKDIGTLTESKNAGQGEPWWFCREHWPWRNDPHAYQQLKETPEAYASR